MSKIRMNVYLDEKQKDTLDKISEKTDVPVAAMIRRAIDAYIKLKQQELREK